MNPSRKMPYMSARMAPLGLLALVCLLLAACSDGNRTESRDTASTDLWADLPKLEIDRPAPEPPAPEIASGPVVDENGMTTLRVPVPPTFFNTTDQRSGSANHNRDAKEILERAGVSFPPGATARYDFHMQQLIVYNTLDQIELVEAYTMPIGSYPERTLSCRVEIFEMSTEAALELQRIANSRMFHEAERKAVLAACRRGEVRLVTTVELPCLNGQRARADSGSEHLVRSPKLDEPKSGNDQPTPLFDWHRSGLVLEIDAVLGADAYTIDLNLSLSLQTAAPEKMTVPILAHDGSPAAPLTVPKFSRAQLVTQVIMFDGSPKLIGTYPLPPTIGESSAKRSQLVFATMSVKWLFD